MTFADARLWWGLGPLYVLWAGAWALRRVLEHRRRIRTTAALRYSTVRTLRALRPSRTLLLRRLIEGLRLIVILLLVVAMGRPQTGRRQSHVWSRGVDIMLAVDTSGSMQALDLDADRPIARRRNRLEVVKDVVAEFIAARETDQVGMVVFGNEAFTQCPLTLDHGIVATFLREVKIGVAGNGTAIGSGLAAAVGRLKKSPAKSKVVILLTDGSNNAGSLTPRKAAEVAQAFGIKVYTIGAGGRGQAPILVDTLFGKQVQYADVDIDEPTLREIASITGGAYFRAEDSRGLAQIYAAIDSLEKSEIEMKSAMDYNERFAAFVWPALGLLLVEVALLATRFRKIP